MTEIGNSVTVLIIAITTIFLITLGNNVFASEYSKYTNNKYGIEFDYPEILFLDSINPSFEGRDNHIIIPVAAKFKDSNQVKIQVCVQSYHNMIFKIFRDDESYWEGSNVACVYGMYNYNINIGDKKMDPLKRSQIELEVTQCMFDDHCMKKINNIIKGKIALQYEFPGSKLSPEVLKYEKERIEAQKDNNQKALTVEEEQWYIEFCAKRVFYSNYLPSFCEDKSQLKEKIEIEVQKLKEKEGN